MLRLVSPDPTRFADRLKRRLDALCARHDDAEMRLYELPRAVFPRACRELREIWRRRDEIRVGLLAMRCGGSERCAQLRARLEREWGRLLEASARLQRLLSDPTSQERVPSVALRG